MNRFLSISHFIVRHYQIRISMHTHTHMAEFLPFFYQAKRIGNEKEILLKRYDSVVGVERWMLRVETAFDATLLASIRTKEKQNWKNGTRKKHVHTVKRSAATNFVWHRSHTICDRSESGGACASVCEQLKLWKLTATFNSIFVTILVHPPSPSTMYQLRCQSTYYWSNVRLCAPELTHWIRHRN